MKQIKKYIQKNGAEGGSALNPLLCSLTPAGWGYLLVHLAFCTVIMPAMSLSGSLCGIVIVMWLGCCHCHHCCPSWVPPLVTFSPSHCPQLSGPTSLNRGVGHCGA